MDLSKYFDNQVKNKWFEWAKNTEKIHVSPEYGEEFISMNPNLTIEMIRDNPDLDWNWYCISGNSAITMNDVENNPNFPWIYESLSFNPNLTVNFVTTHLYKDWDWDVVCKNIGISIDVVQNNPKVPWNFFALRSCEFAPDIQNYVTHHTKNANLLKIHKFFHKNTDKVVKPIEYAIFDEYLLKQILQY